MLKWIIGSLVGISVAAVGLPLISNLSDRDNEAEKLVHAAELSNKQAGDLNDTYTAIIPTHDAQGNPIDETAATTAEPTPDPRYDAYTSESEHEVQAALDHLNALLSETGPPPQTEYITAVQQLQQAWQPRYERAASDYKVFAYRIHHTEKMAQEYFEVQHRLTQTINDPEKRSRSAANDQLEQRAYLEWREQATRTLTHARRIKQDLDDMNVIITKQVLSSNFASLYQDFQEMPQSMLTLHAEIAEFQRQSDHITATFGPPTTQDPTAPQEPETAP